jgi:hypothetical protein
LPTPDIDPTLAIHELEDLRLRVQSELERRERPLVHPVFTHLGVNPDVLAPEWNRDFPDASNCQKNAKRGGYAYTPPGGWQRFGLVPDGDRWLGKTNAPGEWAVVYHGTKPQYVKPLTETPLKEGNGLNHYGVGIYCSPNPEVAEKYAPRSPPIKGVKYLFMVVCRVNVSKVHRCTRRPCPDAGSPNYTVHFTQGKDIWFANGQNESSQNIRAYGILVKKC